MTDDGSNEPYIPEYDEPAMEVVIETLTGTTFEMTVSPMDTIQSIKNKIHRVEGIPVAQQHLLFRMEELPNEARLCDQGITAGSTLRLVLSMRGGPISTRRLASTDQHLAWKEIKEYVDTTREDLLEKLPPGSKVTVLLFREGEHLNLIRVIENEDGTCYPFSDSWLPVGRAKSKENSTTKLSERQAENISMMRKVIELRRKMEGLSVQKKTRKPVKTDDNDLNAPSTSGLNNVNSETVCSSPFNVKSPFEHLPRSIGKRISEVYTDRLLYIQQQRNKTNIGRSHRPYRVDASLVSPKSEEMPLPSRNCASTLPTPSIAILEEEPESSLNKKEAEFSPPSPISIPSGDANTVTMSQVPSLPGTSRNLVHLAHMTHLVLDDHTDRPKSSPEKCEQKTRDLCNILLNDSTERCHNTTGVKMGVGNNRRQSIDYTRNLNYNNTNLPRMQYASNSSSHLNCIDKTSNVISHTRETEQSVDDWSPSYGSLYHRSSNLLTSQYASSSKLNNAHLDSLLGNRVTDLNNARYNEAKRSPLYGRRARIERIRNNIIDNTDDKYGYNNFGYMANIEKIQNDAISINKQSSPLYRRRNILNYSPNTESAQSETPKFGLDVQLPQIIVNNEIKREDNVNSNIHTLPNIIPKKSTRTRCAMCNKRLNITTVHTCRCGGIFCAQHRYSEVHGCQYDYKTEGRKIIEQTNPLVAAPKLPKI